MARPDHLYVFAYDVTKDRARNKVAAALGDHLVRVQFSVFEGRMSAPAALALARRAAMHLGPDDSLRVYCVTEAGRRASLTFGPAPLPEAQDFHLL